jgi:2',3'-cyclic-nucleotide 2'-phosphodiesterase (5'-nucleotidase family)
MLLRIIALLLFVIPVLGQTPAIEPCPAAPKPSITANPEKIGARPGRSVVDASVPDDANVEKIVAPYTEKVLELSKVIGRLEGGLNKTGVGGGTVGNFVADGIKAYATKSGKSPALTIMNVGGLRKNEISAGELRASDVFELLPFENALVAVEVTGVQLAKLIQIVTRDAQSGARIHFKWNEESRPEFLSGKLVDENGKEQEIDPQKLYTVVTINYLLERGGGGYAILQEAKSKTPLNITLRDAIMGYVKSETAAGRPIRGVKDDRFIQVGPDPKVVEPPR